MAQSIFFARDRKKFSRNFFPLVLFLILRSRCSFLRQTGARHLVRTYMRERQSVGGTKEDGFHERQLKSYAPWKRRLPGSNSLFNWRPFFWWDKGRKERGIHSPHVLVVPYKRCMKGWGRDNSLAVLRNRSERSRYANKCGIRSQLRLPLFWSKEEVL